MTYEITAMVKGFAGADLGLHIIETKPGTFVFAGKVPATLRYVDATAEQIEAAKFLPYTKATADRFPKTRVFATKEAAAAFAAAAGYAIE